MRSSIVIGLALAGCVGDSEPAPAGKSSREVFDARVWPALARCAGCHATQPTIDFLAPGTPAAYDTLFGFQPAVIDLGSPGSSLLLTMGLHTGPAFTAPESSAILEWLVAERDARVPDVGERTVLGPFGAETVTLPLPIGGSVRLVASPFSDGVAFSDVSVTAGATGLHVEHPLFVSQPPRAEPILDELDRFADVELDLAPNETVALGGAVFTAFSSIDPLTLHFHALEAP